MIDVNEKFDRIIVTSGSRYIDIDAYASCIVYANILNKMGINAFAYTSSILNESIPKTIFPEEKISRDYTYKSKDKYVVLDVSSPKFFDTFVNEDDVIEVIDHHFGFEEYWNKKIGNSSIIEPIGSVATIITEYAIKTNYLEKITREEVLLLMAAILDNTLNFKAKITTIRDIEAYKVLSEKAQFEDFDEYYFNECEKDIIKDIKSFIKLDTKIEGSKNLPKYFSQIVLWNKNVIENKYQEISQELESFGNDWMCNIIDLEEGKSFVYCTNDESKKKIEKIFNLNFNNTDLLDLNELYLRKEIIKLSNDVD